MVGGYMYKGSQNKHLLGNNHIPVNGGCGDVLMFLTDS